METFSEGELMNSSARPRSEAAWSIPGEDLTVTRVVLILPLCPHGKFRFVVLVLYRFSLTFVLDFLFLYLCGVKCWRISQLFQACCFP